MTDAPDVSLAARKLAARKGVARAATAAAERIRNNPAPYALALLSAAACAPLLVAGSAGLGVALAGVAGNIGSGILTGVIQAALERLGDDKPEPSETAGDAARADAIQDELAAELLTALERGDAQAGELRNELMDLLVRVGGIEAAVRATSDDVRGHLQSCFSQLMAQQNDALRKLQDLSAGQRRQERYSVEQIGLAQQSVGLLISILAQLTERQPSSGEGPPVVFQLVAPAEKAADDGWRGGAQIVGGQTIYQLYGDSLDESFSADYSVRFRQARALQLAPAQPRGQEYAWLRWAECLQRGPVSRAAVDALRRERDLLSGLRIRGMPRVLQLPADETMAMLAVGWPASSVLGGPCETLAADLIPGGAATDEWRTRPLLTGMAGLCFTLAGLHKAGAAHRLLTPAGIIRLADDRLALRDAGLAGHSPRPGEGPDAYRAPEQRRGAARQPGAKTDSYQLAAVTYHLLAGYPPHARNPVPLRAQVPRALSASMTAALAEDPGRRPDIRALGEAFRSARDELC